MNHDITEVQEAASMMLKAAESAILDIVSIASRMKQFGSTEDHLHVCDLAMELHSYVEESVFNMLEAEGAEGSEIRGHSAPSAQ